MRRVWTIRPRSAAGALLGDTAANWLISRFAAYLARYGEVVVTYDGKRLDPKATLERQEDRPLDGSMGGDFGATLLRVIEWKPEIIGHKSSILLCGHGRRRVARDQ